MYPPYFKKSGDTYFDDTKNPLAKPRLPLILP